MHRPHAVAPVVVTLLCLACTAQSPGTPAAGAGAQAPQAGQTAAGGSGGAGGAAGSSGSSAPTGGGGRAGSGVAPASSAGTGSAGTGGAGGAGGSAAIAGTGGEAGADAGVVALDLPGGPIAIFPRLGGQDTCADASLHVRFSAPPTLGTQGKLRVFDADAPTSPVASVDMAVTSVSDSAGGTTFAMPRRVHLDGDEAVFYLPSHALAYGHAYYVTLEPGVLTAPDGSAFAFDDASTWTFHTRASAPAPVAGALGVALDGRGEYCSVQGAVDAAQGPVVITLEPGTYHEIVHWASKDDLTLRGRDRETTIIAGVNNEKQNGGTAKRALVGIDDSQGVVIEDLTIHNLTPQDGSQAEALRMQRCDQCIVRRANILSLQDTLLWSGRIFAQDCYVEGNVDYVWGTGTVYFDRCEFHTVGRKGYLVQARNPASTYGYVFVDCKLTSDAGVTGDILARIDVGAYPASHVAFVDCEMGSQIAASGWLVSGVGSTSGLRFWEYQSKRPTGEAVDIGQRLGSSHQLTAPEAATMRDPGAVLGGWTPQAPAGG